MKLLVLGGTGFLGYHVVAEAVKLGHHVTTFNRQGESDIEEVEALQGDRKGDLSALRGRTWDAVIDTFSDPHAITEAAKLLSNAVSAYGFISGISHYHPNGPDTVDEDAPLRREGDPAGDDPLQARSLKKLACERALKEHFSGDLLITRPGIMVGPRDPTDRFTWWPLRFLRSSSQTPILTPGDPERTVQFTDARDLAAWLVRSLDPASTPLTGTYNTVGPGRAERLSDVLAACLEAARDVAGLDAPNTELVWAGEGFLREQLAEVEEEARPLWFPEDQIPFDKVDSSKALATGLHFRATYNTAKDTLLWAKARGKTLKAGFSPEFEQVLIKRWKGRK